MNEVGRDSELYQLIFAQRWDEARDLLHSKDVSSSKKNSMVFYRDQDGRVPLTVTKRKKSCNPFMMIPEDICLIMLDIGGDGLVKVSDDCNRTILHHVEDSLWIGRSRKVLNYILQLGGRELSLMVDETRETALHKACSAKDPQIFVIDLLLKIGGKGLARMVNSSECTALHELCRQQHPCKEAVLKVIDVGENDLVLMHDKSKRSALYHLLSHEYPPTDLINCIIQRGGEYLLQSCVESKLTNTSQRTIFNSTPSYKESVKYLINQGGKRLTLMYDDSM